MNNDRFVEIAKSIATDYKTLYIMGCFGAPMNEANKKEPNLITLRRSIAIFRIFEN